MLHSNGHNPCTDCKQNPANATRDTGQVSATCCLLKPAQIKFLNAVLPYHPAELTESFQLVHDLVMYHTDIPIEQKEKSALLDLKIFISGLEKLDG